MPFKDPEREREYRRQYRLENYDRILVNQKKWRENNPERDRIYYDANRQRILDTQMARYYADRERFLNYQVEYRKTLDKEKVKKYKAEYIKERAKTDPAFAILLRLRRRLTKAVTTCGCKKSARTMELVGCNLGDLIKHLENQFVPEMSWDNRELWQIDHIRPCSSFDLNDPIQQRECFHYTNLQPLWVEDNRKKGKRNIGLNNRNDLVLK